jgi:nucleoside-diphosphate-sugar epimerase
MRVLVTGATGFIGNYIIQELLQKNISIIATSSNEAIAKSKSWYSKVIYLPLNLSKINDTENYYNYFKQPDIVIHLAWSGLPNYKSDFHLTENLPIQIKFLDNLINNGLKDLTVCGTCFEYGMQEGALDETMECTPTNAYGIAKNELRKSLQEKKIDLKWVRLFYMYGKGQNPNSLFTQLENAIANDDQIFNMSGGQQTRDFLAIENVAKYIVAIALQNNVLGIINCSSGNPITVKQFVENYLKQKNKIMQLNLGYFPYSDFEPMNFWGVNKKLQKIINKK